MSDLLFSEFNYSPFLVSINKTYLANTAHGKVSDACLEFISSSFRSDVRANAEPSGWPAWLPFARSLFAFLRFMIKCSNMLQLQLKLYMGDSRACPSAAQRTFILKFTLSYVTQYLNNVTINLVVVNYNKNISAAGLY
uniref:Uncharacterized protein n=1 Tax=Pipistrellus kuhlii TaxID=59472 RepID=A0A7J8B243_PIPKU|nr:hypothetical protein mPipKuh1_007747 [Pipistrellus kuhlii]